MKNLRKPLTWGLVIVLLGYLFIANCDCEDASCTFFKCSNNELNIESENDTIKPQNKLIEIQAEDENLNVDSIVSAVLEDIDMKGDIDTVIEIDLKEETKER